MNTLNSSLSDVAITVRDSEIQTLKTQEKSLFDLLPLSAKVEPLIEAKRELDRLFTSPCSCVTLPTALRFVRRIERMNPKEQFSIREMSPVDLVVYFAHTLYVRQNQLQTRHPQLFQLLSVPQYLQVIELTKYGMEKYPHRFVKQENRSN